MFAWYPWGWKTGREREAMNANDHLINYMVDGWNKQVMSEDNYNIALQKGHQAPEKGRTATV